MLCSIMIQLGQCSAVVDIALVGETVLLCVLEFYGKYFHSHYNAFEITHRGVHTAVKI